MNFDVIIVGGGHAGIEAAYAAARMGSKTLLLTLNLDRIGYMPCNPAIGGIGKGHIVFEISAFGGLMPQLCTQTYVQARMLNTKKGPAVQGLRLQIDKVAYNALSKKKLEMTPGLTIASAMVDEILTKDDHVIGLKTREGSTYYARSIVLTTGTFLNGLVHIGQTNYASGRQGEEAVTKLSAFLKSLDLAMGRLKTGTPPRLIRSSVDFSKMTVQQSDNLPYLFEFDPHTVTHKMDCYITHTTSATRDIILQNAEHSPIFSKKIEGIAPRYCPSIEDKVVRFSHKETHHVFVEPESASTNEIYPNGLSTSLPLPIQEQFIRTIPGFEHAIIARPGYAIEYDFILPNQLSHSLELKKLRGLFLAGQINGTTGYEEAAGQGLIAGINAHLKAHNHAPYHMSRNEGYIGIMIDDLVTLGVDEPYRMFTSRAERRLILRQDNVFIRLGPQAHALGLLSDERYKAISHEKELIEQWTTTLLASSQQSIARLLSEGKTEEVISMITTQCGSISERVKTGIFAELLYGPYLKREQHEIEKMEYYQTLEIPHDRDYKDIPGLSIELQQKLTRIKPRTIAQAMLIPGMTPAAISLLIFKVREQACSK